MLANFLLIQRRIYQLGIAYRLEAGIFIVVPDAS